MPDPLIRDPLVGPLAASLGFPEPLLALLSIAVLVWIVYWKAVALWIAAQNGQRWWFGALLLVHTVGILELVYLLLFEKKSPQGHTQLLPLPKVFKDVRAFVRKESK